VSASRGPIPHRTEERRRENAPSDGLEVTKAPAAAEVTIPDPDEDWHIIANDWYVSLTESGQSRFYEPSDWMTAYLLAEQISRLLKPRFVGFQQYADGGTEPVIRSIPMAGADVTALLRGMTSLMVTEGDRRRARLELQRSGEDEGPSASVTAITDARSALTLVPTP